MIHYLADLSPLPRQIFLFGSGQIGSAIDIALRRQNWCVAQRIHWPWHNTEAQKMLIDDLGRNLRAPRTDVIWAAGVSGFGSSDAEMLTEATALGEVARLATHLAGNSHPVVFHLFSSLGGLFEGQVCINDDSIPAPTRAYGRGKLAQENLIRALEPTIIPRIYRPSSVYGTAAKGRQGLFTAIATAMLRKKPLTIYGSANTLRDYVFASDIADYVATVLCEERVRACTDILASGKPTTISEAIFYIETWLERRLYHRFDSTPHNALSMSILPSALPPQLPRTALSTGVSAVLQNVCGRLIAKGLRN